MEVVTEKPNLEGVPEGYKRTDVGVIPEDWELRSLEEVCIKIQDGNYGGSYPTSNEFVGYGVPFLTSKAIGKDGILKEELIDYISKKKHKELLKAHLSLNDIIFTNRGASVGAVGFVDQRIAHGNIGPQLTLLRANKEVARPIYLFHIMKSDFIQNQMYGQGSGSAMNFFGIGATKKFKIPLPPTLEEQQAIAESLSDVDALIAELDALIEKKQQIKKGAMQQLLTAKKRLPGFGGEWEEKKLGDLLTVMHGKSQKSVASESGEYPILGTSGQIGKATSYLYDKPSVLIGRKGTIDRPQYMDKPFWTIDTLFYTHVNENAIAKFLYYRFLLIDWTSYNEASGVPSLNSSTIENIEILFPKGIEEQKAIVEILSDMDAVIQVLQAKRSKYEEIKQGMMQELLTGKTRLV